MARVFQTIAQRLALEQFRDGVNQTRLVADIVQRENVGMIECRHRARFALEACDHLLDRAAVGDESP